MFAGFKLEYVKDEKDNVSSSVTAVLLKFYALHSLESYILYKLSLRSVYYNAYPLTQYFQMQIIMFIEKSEHLSAKWQRDLQAKKRTYHGSPKGKR